MTDLLIFSLTYAIRYLVDPVNRLEPVGAEAL